MKLSKTTPYILAFLLASICHAQSGKQKKAAKDYADFAYSDAIEGYARLVKDGYSDQEIYQKLGNANYNNARYEEAVQWYTKLFELNIEDIEADYLYRYAQSLKSLEKYGESDSWMERFQAKKNGDQRAKKFGDNRGYLEDIKQRSGKFNILLAKFNSKVSDFAPSIYKDAVVFSSARDTGLFSRNIHEWNKGAFLDLYTSKLDDYDSLVAITKFSKNLNKKTHESSTAFSKDGNTLYFTRNNSEAGKRFSHDDKGISRLKLMRAELVDGEWRNIVELPFNAASHSVAHPALNADGTKLYFSSDMEGSLGASDIFYVDILDDGTYGEPVNLGNTINTEARETFPFIAENNILFFASDGHPGLGGLDVFAVDLQQGTTGEVINLGEPINSTNDDFSLVFDQNLEKGYFASNRTGGMGDDDIYSFTVTEPLNFAAPMMITGLVKEMDSGEPIAGADVLLKGSDSDFAAQLITDENGSFSFAVPQSDTKIVALASKSEYLEDTKTLALDEPQGELVLFLQKDESELVQEQSLSASLELPIIYFDFDISNIRSDAQTELGKLIEILKANPDLKLAIKSFTDSRGNQDYNQGLSDRRARATKEYLVKNGIASSRLTIKGYGEEQLTNDCNSSTDCSEPQHQANRRSEFEIEK